jgi:hypothetical protein
MEHALKKGVVTCSFIHGALHELAESLLGLEVPLPSG